MAIRNIKEQKSIVYYEFGEVVNEVIAVLKRDHPSIEHHIFGNDASKPSDFWSYWRRHEDIDSEVGQISSTPIFMMELFDYATDMINDDPEWHDRWLLPIYTAFVEVLGEDAKTAIHFKY